MLVSDTDGTMTATNIRMRIAPSPTGEPHIGTAYIALFNLLLAKHLSGQVILRIEDTDQARSTPDAEAKLLEALDWLELPLAEGPATGGNFGPYRQSERKALYQGYVEELLKKGHAFKCYCTRERLEEMRQHQRSQGKQQKYDGFCLSLPPKELAHIEAERTPYVVRMKVPDTGECSFEDKITGTVTIPYETVDMQVIQKSDGMPTYHLASVVDDHLMKITHVARGEEWLSSVPKHILLYQYFGWETPEWYHLPLMRNKDRSKLSKRRNPTSLSYFQAAGFLPKALLNYLGLFFISIAEGEELKDLSELAEQFEPSAVGKAGAVFDMQKLEWLNGQWIRERMTNADFRAAVADWAETRLTEVMDLARTRTTKLSDLPDLCGFILKDDLSLSYTQFAQLKTGVEDNLAILRAVLPIVETLGGWTSETIQAEIGRVAEEELHKKLRLVVPPLFLALTGSTRSLPLFDSMAILGRSIVRQRLTRAIATIEKGAP